MKHCLFALFLLGAVPDISAGAGPAKPQKSELSAFPSPDTPGYAEWNTWIFLAESELGFKYSVKRVVLTKKSVDFWLRVERPALPPCEEEKPRNGFMESPYDPVARAGRKRACARRRAEADAYVIQHIIGDCKRRQIKQLEEASYNAAGDVLDSSNGRDRWSAVFPDSAMEVVLMDVCKDAI